MLWLCQFYLSAWIIRKKYVELIRHANPCIHNSENHMFLWVVLFSCLLTLVYQLIVKSMRAFVYRCLLLLWSVKPFCPEWLGETNSSTSSISRIGSKKLCSTLQIANPAFVLLYLGVLPSLYRDVIGIAHHPMNSWYSDTSCHHCSFLGSCVIVTGMPTNESWRVKSILLATLLLGS